jgi:N-methylhydantoinase B
VGQVERDVLAGLVSTAQAEEAYGVVFRDGAVDMQATDERRSRASSSTELFDYGPGRDAFEAVWTRRRYEKLTELLARTSIPWRHWVKKAIFTAVDTGQHAEKGPRDQVNAIFSDLRSRYPQLVEGGSADIEI